MPEGLLQRASLAGALKAGILMIVSLVFLGLYFSNNKMKYEMALVIPPTPLKAIFDPVAEKASGVRKMYTAESDNEFEETKRSVCLNNTENSHKRSHIKSII